MSDQPLSPTLHDFLAWYEQVDDGAAQDAERVRAVAVARGVDPLELDTESWKALSPAESNHGGPDAEPDLDAHRRAVRRWLLFVNRVAPEGLDPPLHPVLRAWTRHPEMVRYRSRASRANDARKVNQIVLFEGGVDPRELYVADTTWYFNLGGGTRGSVAAIRYLAEQGPGGQVNMATAMDYQSALSRLEDWLSATGSWKRPLEDFDDGPPAAHDAADHQLGVD